MECRNKFQRLQWNEQGKEEGQVKDEEMGFNLRGIKYNGITNRQAMVRDCWEWMKTLVEGKVCSGL
jgi:hypothetical protein